MESMADNANPSPGILAVVAGWAVGAVPSPVDPSVVVLAESTSDSNSVSQPTTDSAIRPRTDTHHGINGRQCQSIARHRGCSCWVGGRSGTVAGGSFRRRSRREHLRFKLSQPPDHGLSYKTKNRYTPWNQWQTMPIHCQASWLYDGVGGASVVTFAESSSDSNSVSHTTTDSAKDQEQIHTMRSMADNANPSPGILAVR